MDVDLRSESCAELKKLNDAFLAVVKEAVEEENAARSTREGRIQADPGRSATGRAARRRSRRGREDRGLRRSAAPAYAISSTDSNVPMNMGIPAVTIGRGGRGGRGHSPPTSGRTSRAKARAA